MSNEQYINYLQNISARNDDPQRVLLISENMGAGETAKYISGLLHKVFPEVDLATVGSYYNAPYMSVLTIFMLVEREKMLGVQFLTHLKTRSLRAKQEQDVIK